MLTLLLALALDTQALARARSGVQVAWQNTRIPEAPASPR